MKPYRYPKRSYWAEGFLRSESALLGLEIQATKRRAYGGDPPVSSEDRRWRAFMPRTLRPGEKAGLKTWAAHVVDFIARGRLQQTIVDITGNQKLQRIEAQLSDIQRRIS